MEKQTVVKTIHGKHCTYDVVKEGGGVFGDPKYYVHRDGRPFKGSYSSLADAVQAAIDAG